MSLTEEKKQEFVQLIDQALSQSEAMRRQAPTRAEQLDRLVDELERIKSTTLSDALPPSEGTLTLGLSRGLADWIDPLNSPLMDAVGAIELYYQRQL